MSGIYTVYDWHEAHEADLTGLHVPPSPANNHYSWHVAVDMQYYTLRGWGGASAELQARSHSTQVHKVKRGVVVYIHMNKIKDHTVLHCLHQ